MYRPPFDPANSLVVTDGKTESCGLVQAKPGTHVPVAPAPVAPPAAPENPWNLLVATALKSAPASEEALVEDALTRRAAAALSPDEAARLKPLADQVALLEVEYFAASGRYHEAEGAAPTRTEWANPQHYLEACKAHERRMDRLQRGMRDAHERLLGAIDQLERTRGGGAPRGGATKSVGVELTQDGTGTSRARVGIQG